MPDDLVNRYSQDAYDWFVKQPELAAFPEWVLQQLDQDWFSGYPSREEVDIYPVNNIYVQYLLERIGDGTGETLEILAEYLLSVMPGIRTYRRKKTKSTDYDIVCAVDGLETDFRSEFGRPFLAECKDWGKPADFTTIAKFCRIL